MIALKQLILIDKTSDIPVYLQITNTIISNIRRGQLRRGMKLPGARELSVLLGIHRKTLQNAYDELMAQG
ncbi:MAG: GntR family transcriptional regulator [Bacteroidales bacterium]|nr:GntR family transcriptional regulator [Bacteroidales bacterium]